MSEYEQAFDEYNQEDPQVLEQKRLDEVLQVFGHRLQSLADKQVQDRGDIEDRWLQDLRAYHGKYDESTLDSIKKNKGSEIFVNLTRHKCNTAEARLVDMLFPNDDRNWGINPTPSPQINKAMQSQQMARLPDGREVPERDLAEKATEEANRKAKEMEREIDDQLVEADYAAKCRDVIHDAVIFGTGIIKGPVVEGRTNQRWDILDDGTSVLKIGESLEPTVEVVSPWDYFPDMQARNKDELEFEFERKYLTKKHVRDLLKLPGVIKEQVMSVLKEDDMQLDTDDSFADKREISGDNTNVTRERYIMWEYHGYIEPDELEAVGMEDPDGIGMNGTVLLLNGRVIRVSLNPLDTEESPYSVFNWEVDANSLFGFGVPYLIRSPQKMVNAAVRMMLDNARLSVAPQIIMNKKVVTPADGQWSFSPFKRWYVQDDTMPINQAMQFVNVPSQQADLSQIYQLSRFLIDEQSSLPAVATGEGDPSASPQTATGVAINSGAAKVVFKRVVKNFDDDLTAPIIKRFYDWNMQYNDNPEIKGDMQVAAMGSSTLMVREQEAQIMSDVLGMVDPQEIAMRVKPEEAIKEFFKSRNINASNILRTDEEVDKIKERMAEQGNQSPDMAKLQMQAQIEQAKLQMKDKELQMDMQQWATEAQQKEQQLMLEHEQKMQQLAAEQQTTVEKLKQGAGDTALKAQLDQMKIANQREIEQQRLDTQRQIAAIKAQQETNKQMMQQANLQAGYDTF